MTFNSSQVSVQVFRYDVIAQTTGIAKQQSTIQGRILCKHDVVVESVHVSIRKFQDRVSSIDGFVFVNAHPQMLNHHQIFVDDFHMVKSRLSNHFLGLVRIIAQNDVDVDVVSDIFHRLTENAVVVCKSLFPTQSLLVVFFPC